MDSYTLVTQTIEHFQYAETSLAYASPLTSPSKVIAVMICLKVNQFAYLKGCVCVCVCVLILMFCLSPKVGKNRCPSSRG
jgi:hypothetical protein